MLSASVVAVTAEDAGTKPSDPALKLAKVADKSKPATTVVEGECPGMGSAWIQLAPADQKAAVLGKVDDVRAAHKKADPKSKNAHKE